MERGSKRFQTPREKEREIRRARYRENCKEELIASIERRMKTLMIGSLASFEKFYDGVIKKDDELWQEVRQEILDKGNHQIRSVVEELAQYEVDKVGYRTYFNVRSNNNG